MNDRLNPHLAESIMAPLAAGELWQLTWATDLPLTLNILLDQN